MTPETVIEVGQRTLQMIAYISGPLLLAALAVGVLVGMIQAATQINEMTLSFIPKLMALGATLVIAGSWMLSQLIAFTEEIFSNIPGLIG